MHQAYGDGIDFVFFHQAPDGVHDIVPVERHDFVALIIHAFAHANDALSGDERFGLGDPGDVLDLVVGETVDPADGAHDLGRVFKSLGGNQPDLAAVVRDQRIGGDRAAVFEETRLTEQFARVHADGAGGLLHRVHDTARKIVGRGRSLRRPHFAAIAQHDHVGECSAGIDADDVILFCRHGCLSDANLSMEI